MAAGGFQHKSSKLHHDEIILAVTQQERDSSRAQAQEFHPECAGIIKNGLCGRGLLETAWCSTPPSRVLTTACCRRTLSLTCTKVSDHCSSGPGCHEQDTADGAGGLLPALAVSHLKSVLTCERVRTQLTILHAMPASGPLEAKSPACNLRGAAALFSHTQS